MPKKKKKKKKKQKQKKKKEEEEEEEEEDILFLPDSMQHFLISHTIGPTDLPKPQPKNKDSTCTRNFVLHKNRDLACAMNVYLNENEGQ
jgi:hypothetical protein